MIFLLLMYDEYDEFFGFTSSEVRKMLEYYGVADKEDVLASATDDIRERLYALLRGEKVVAGIDQNVVYRSLTEEPQIFIVFYLCPGILKRLRRRYRPMDLICERYIFQTEK